MYRSGNGFTHRAIRCGEGHGHRYSRSRFIEFDPVDQSQVDHVQTDLDGGRRQENGPLPDSMFETPFFQLGQQEDGIRLWCANNACPSGRSSSFPRIIIIGIGIDSSRTSTVTILA
ncbi:MAG TPA: hypothetical protein VN616_11445 [Puia sp.]|nr:hypothetical protein [Puia sp.]